MCIILAKPANVALPTDKVLDNCERSNRDGIGVAVTQDGKVKITKNFNDVDHFKEWMRVNVRQADAMIVHFRLCTSGAVCTGLRHPFPLSKDHREIMAEEFVTDVVVAHNGILWTPSAKEVLSDTGMFVRDILADAAIKDSIRDNYAVQTLVLGMLGGTNKLAMLWGDGYVLTFGKFYKDKGILYSNEQYKPIVYIGEEEAYGYGDFFNGGHRGADCSLGNALSKRETKAERRRKYMEFCSMCYNEEYTSAMFKDTRKEADEDGKLCRKCHVAIGGLRPKLLGADSETPADAQDNVTPVEQRCNMCNEFVPMEDINYFDFAAEGDAPDMLGVCRECQLELHMPMEEAEKNR